MHIAEGILSGSTTGNLLLAGSTIATGCVAALSLRMLDERQVPRVAMLGSAFFVLSFVSVSFGGAGSTHFIFNGLMGLLLGWAAVLAILTALLVQYLFFGIGGLTTLGLNCLTMAIPAIVCYYMFRSMVGSSRPGITWLAGFGAGVLGVWLAVVLHAIALMTVGAGFLAASGVSCLADLALGPIEGVVTGTMVLFLVRVRPELFEWKCTETNPRSV